MTFASDLDELQHWIGLLTVDIHMGVERRHILAEARLCWLFIERLENNQERVNRHALNHITLQMLNLQRAIDDSAPREPAKPMPRLRLVP